MKNFLEFLKDVPTAFHAANKIKKILKGQGYQELHEQDAWQLEPGKKYFLGRNMSSLIAFTLPSQEISSFNIVAAHLDSPTFKIKPNGIIETGRYLKLNTEVYGGPIYNTWMDRPLGIAGRVVYSTVQGITAKLVNINKPVALIPHLPIHYNKTVNQGESLNPQIDMMPIIADKGMKEASLLELICSEIGIASEDVLSTDLYLSMLDRGMLAGINEDFVMAPQIDNLECSYACFSALLESENPHSVNVIALFDNEEIGSSTRQGAAGTLLEDTLQRISLSLGKNTLEHYQLLSKSFIVSADNAQGFHPNYPEKYDKTNACFLNGGIVIKNAARGSYSTDAFSSAYFQSVCKKAGVKYQLNTNRSDIPGGSTLGVLSLQHVSIPSVDIGLAQLAMHSAYETAGSHDLAELIAALKEFFCSTIVSCDEENLNF